MMEARHGWPWLSVPSNTGIMRILNGMNGQKDGHGVHGIDKTVQEKEGKEPQGFLAYWLLGLELILTVSAAFIVVLGSDLVSRVVEIAAKVITQNDTIADGSKVMIASFLQGYAAIVVMTWAFNENKDRMIRQLGMLSNHKSTCPSLLLLAAVYVILLAIAGHIKHGSIHSMLAVYIENWVSSVASTSHVVRILKSLVLIPAVEELWFRALIFHLTYNRLRSPIAAALASSTLFSLLHLINYRQVQSGSMSVSYLVRQMIAAFLFGTLLSLRFQLNGKLLETILLHSMNNLFAIIAQPKTNTPSFILDFLFLLLYVLLVFYTCQQVAKLKLP